jgi:hypothetical protein
MLTFLPELYHFFTPFPAGDDYRFSGNDEKLDGRAGRRTACPGTDPNEEGFR